MYIKMLESIFRAKRVLLRTINSPLDHWGSFNAHNYITWFIEAQWGSPHRTAVRTGGAKGDGVQARIRGP